MAHGNPDYITQVQVAVTIETSPGVFEPIVPKTAEERAAGGAGRYSGNDATYQTVVTWTVATGKVGELKEILILSDNYAATLAQVIIGDITWATVWGPQAAMPLIFEDLKLEAGTVVTISARALGEVTITVDAIITAKEIG